MKHLRTYGLVLTLALLAIQTQAQQKPAASENKKSRTKKTCTSRDWDEVGQELGAAFEQLGHKLSQTLSDPDLWQDVGQEVARAGREASREVTRELSNLEFDGHSSHTFDDEKTKKFSKSFRLAAGDQLAIENKFGKVHINTWDKPETTVEVVMTARSSSDSKAQALLDRISIVVDENKTENEVLVKTQFENMNNWGGGKQSFVINYTVNMPRNNPLRIKNSFGDTYVAELNGKSNLQCSYGNLKADRLAHNDNYVKVAFGSGRVGYCKGGEVKVSYSNLEITESENLVIESSFSELSIRNIQSARVKAKYGSVDMGTNGKGFKSFDIAGSFSDIDLRLPANMGFDFDIKVSYADLDWHNSEARFTSVEKSGNSKSYVGSFGKSSAGSIRVNSRYGDVDFKLRD